MQRSKQRKLAAVLPTHLPDAMLAVAFNKITNKTSRAKVQARYSRRVAR